MGMIRTPLSPVVMNGVVTPHGAHGAPPGLGRPNPKISNEKILPQPTVHVEGKAIQLKYDHVTFLLNVPNLPLPTK